MAEPKTNAIRKETLQNLILDAGVVYANYGNEEERIIGVTEGGNTFNVEREIREIPMDGAKGKVKGGRRVLTINATLTVNLKEMSKENLELALTATEVTDYPETEATHDELRPKTEILETDYKDNVALVAKVSGSSKPVIVILENVLSDGNFEIGATDQEEAVIPVELSAHYDPEEDEPEVPFVVRYPKDTDKDII